MGFFSRNKNIDKDGNNFYDKPSFHLYFINTVQPDLSGARRYAYGSLQLPPVAPSGTGITPPGLSNYKRTGKQLYVFPVKKLVGIPTSSGQLYKQPLYDPAVGYTSSMRQPPSPLVNINIPISIPKAVGINDANPTNIR